MRRYAKFLVAGSVYGVLITAASAGDVPTIKQGLWSTTTNLGDSAPVQKGTMCTSTALLQTLFDNQFKKANPPCKRSNVVQKGSTISEEHECKFNGDKPVKSSLTTTVTGDSAVHTEVRQEGKTALIVSDSKYVSACPAGMQLGDYVGETGTKFNVLHPDDGKAQKSQ